MSEDVRSSPEERIFRYELLETARRLYKDFHVEDRVKNLAGCSSFAPLKNGLWFVVKGNSVMVSGMNRCHSRSSCPVCSLPSQAESLQQIRNGIYNGRKKGLCPYLVTFTFSHGLADELPVIQSAFQMARERMYRSGGLRGLMREAGYVGRITNYEVQMCGDNGYHPHSHELEFFKCDVDPEDLRRLYVDYYLKALESVGLTAREDVGVDVEGYRGVGDYLTKFSSELTLHLFTKESFGSGSLSPMKCLTMYHNTRDRWYGVWFVDYVLHVKRKRMIGWSRGLKSLLDVTDRDLWDEEEEDLEYPLLVISNPDDVRRISVSDWRRIQEELAQGNMDDITDYLKRVSISYYVSFEGLRKLENR